MIHIQKLGGIAACANGIVSGKPIALECRQAIPNDRRATIGRALMAVTDMVSIPITLEQLIIAVQQLQPDERAQLASTLVQAGLRSDLKALIQELYAQPPNDDITDDDIMAEIKAVRQQSQEA
jgi:hypothetical protein